MKLRWRYDPKVSNVRTLTVEFSDEEMAQAGLSAKLHRVWGQPAASKVDYLELVLRLAREQHYAESRDHARRAYGSRAEKNRPLTAEELRRQAEELLRKAGIDYDFGNFNYFTGGAYRAYRQPTSDPAWCKVLGLPKTASKTEIKIKYRQLAQKHHPDKGGDAKKFAAITQAYQEAMQ